MLDKWYYFGINKRRRNATVSVSLLKTEAICEAVPFVDGMELADAGRALVDSHLVAAKAVSDKLNDLIHASELTANCLRSGGRLIYCGAGSSGLMAMADGLEIPATFGIHKSQIVILLAESIEKIENFEAASEDSVDQASTDFEKTNPGPSDCVIAVSASGSTPYVVEFARLASQVGSATIGVANNANSELAQVSKYSIELETSSEMVSGSTRLSAATSQKIALNTISTLMGIRLGHVYQGRMVNLDPGNIKLRNRAERIVSEIAGVSQTEANDFLRQSGGNVKLAILIAAGAEDSHSAKLILNKAKGQLATALAEF